jgi:hypothetical protein
MLNLRYSDRFHACYMADYFKFLLHLITLIVFGKEFKLWNSSLRTFLQLPVTSSFLNANRILSIVFSHTLNVCPSLRERDQVSQPYKPTSDIIKLTSSDSTLEKEKFRTKQYQVFPRIYFVLKLLAEVISGNLLIQDVIYISSPTTSIM